MLFEIEKPRLLYFKEHFDISEKVILHNHDNKYFISILPRLKINMIVFLYQEMK